ncbi:hypothetical protein M5K25_010531 [Dendrobium thyrsiflorum]|uniref:Uncharacterized protein n=1 Tax=Dendrobium thyrsiflorum TaxID=117978 RepID=A0ABD0V0T9_DENTH
MDLPSCRSNLHNSLFTVAASPPRCSLLRYQRLLLRYQRKQNGVRCSADRRELFTRIAPVYDNLNDLLSLGQHRIWKKMCVSWSGFRGKFWKADEIVDKTLPRDFALISRGLYDLSSGFL